MPNSQNPSTIIQRVQAAGVVGAGGGGFPAWRKLSNRAEVVIANACECEPLLHHDKTLLRLHPERVIRGLLATLQATGARQGIIAVKKTATAACRSLNSLLEKHAPYLKLHLVDDFYPAGDEILLVYETTGRLLPPGGLPLQAGVLVHNVATLAQIADALQGKPVTQRLVTVAGCVRQPKVLLVPLGTPFSLLLERCGGTSIADYIILEGGPMMGRLARKANYTTKTTTALIVLPAQHRLAQRHSTPWTLKLRHQKSACEACRLCTDFCPRYLLGHPILPHLTIRTVAYELDDGGLTPETSAARLFHSQPALAAAQPILSAFLCSQCGVCELLACPCGLAPRATFAALKKELLRQRLPNPYSTIRYIPAPHPQRESRRLPISRLIQQLGLTPFVKEPSYDPLPLTPDEVTISTPYPLIPLVEKGAYVTAGTPLFHSADRQFTFHASISGKVTHLTPHQATISH